MSQLFDLICLLDHIHRQNIFVRLIDLLFQIRRQRQQLIGIRHQPLLSLRASNLFLLFQPAGIGGWIKIGRLVHLARIMLALYLLKLSPTHVC